MPLSDQTSSQRGPSALARVLNRPLSPGRPPSRNRPGSASKIPRWIGKTRAESPTIAAAASEKIAQIGSQRKQIERDRALLAKKKVNLAAYENQGELRGFTATRQDLDGLRAMKGDKWAKAQAMATGKRGKFPDAIPDTMTNEEIAAINGYTGSDYKILNTMLRNGGKDSVKGLRPGESFAPAQVLSYINCVASALNKMPPVSDEKRTVYRGTSLPKPVLDTYEVGKSVSDKAFLSSSLDRQVSMGGMAGAASNVQFTIKHHTGKDVGIFTNHENESEIIFLPGTTFKVVARKDPAGAVGPKNPVKLNLEEVNEYDEPRAAQGLE